MDVKKLKEIEHIANPLHVGCRLIDLGFKRAQADALGKLYEYIAKKLIRQMLLSFARRKLGK